MLTCKELSALSDEILEGSLPFKQKASVKLHLAMCKHCRRYLGNLKLTLSVIQEGDRVRTNTAKIDQIMEHVTTEALTKPD